MSVPDLIASRYRLVSQVGSGGMGLVYKAIDTKLDRAVAIKAINRAKLERHGTVDRLREEALAAASLDHPFICRIYELVDDGADTFIVMEFVEGETLASMMHRGRLPLPETVRLFGEIAEGLANAHARGLVHRDIKPSNVMVTPHGHVKLLDFGIAHPDMSSTPDADTKTSPDAPAGKGGTPQYMAPEQATGAPVTARADLFSLGVAMYECLSGRLPFEGSTDYDYVHHLIASAPRPLHKFAPDAPDDLVQLVEQCLERTPAHRPESAAFIATELRRIGGHLTSPATTLESVRVVRRRRRRTLIVGAALIAVAGIAFAAWQWMQPHWGPIGRNRPVTTSPGREFGSRISPDGKWILFVSARGDTGQVFVQQIDGLQPQPVALPAGRYEGCVWSPDQTKLGCLVWHGDQLTLQIVPALFGGTPLQTFVLTSEIGGAPPLRWVGDSIFLASRGQSRGAITLQKVDANTGVRSEVSGAWTSMHGVEEMDVRPDGLEVAIFVLLPDEGRELWVADIGGTSSKRLTPADDHDAKRLPVWSADGKTIVYQSNRGGQADLWQIDRRTGQQRRLTTSPEIELPESVSIDGSISFQLVDESASLWSWLTAATSSGRPLSEEGLSTFAPTFSRDGRVVAFQRSLPSPREGFVVLDSTLVLANAEGQSVTGMRDVSDGSLPRLSPDGLRLAYHQRAPNNRARVRVINRDTGQTLTLSETGMFGANLVSFPVVWADQPMVWSPSGDALYFVDREDASQNPSYRIRRAKMAAGLDGLSVLRSTPDRISDLQMSPDGRQLAYVAGRAPNAKDRAATSTREYELHVIDIESGKDDVWASFPRGRTLCRGWTPDGRSIVVVRVGKRFDDATNAIEVQLAAAGGTPRTLGTVEHVVQETIRVLPGRPFLYMTRSEGGVANIYSWSLDTQTLRAITDNSQVDVTFANVEPFGADRLVGVRDVRKHDIWLLDARATPAPKAASTPR